MDGFEFNKIAASVLVSGIAVMIVSNVADILYQPNKEFKRGYQIQVHENIQAGPVKQKTEVLDIATLMSNADASRGKADIKRCAICHTFNSGGKNKVGPNLWGIVGAKRAHKDDFSYSKALATKGGSWNAEELLKFVHGPRKYLPGTKMAFAGYRKPQDAADVVAFLETLK